MSLHRGARDAEEAVLRRLDELLPARLLEVDPSALLLPVRVVVPSSQLRLHLSERLVRRRGRAVAGVRIQTLHSVAMEVLERCGVADPSNRFLFDVIAERLAREEPLLAGPLEPLVDGYLAVSGTLRDLLDAGLEPALLEAAEELLATEGPSRAPRHEVDRGRALLRVAAATDQALEWIGASRVTRSFQQAQQLLEQDPDLALPARSVLIFGFADATGRATDLLEALVRHRHARLYIDLPPDPALEDVQEVSFPHPFVERFGGNADGRSAHLGEASSAPLHLERVEATDPETEVLTVADRLRALLDRGQRPESVAVVARNLEPYELSIWNRFSELGIPYTAPSARGSLTAIRRRAEALLSLLTRSGDTPTDVWLEALALSSLADVGTPAVMDSLRMELRIAFHAVGAGRLGQAEELDPAPWIRHGVFPLPVLQGLDEEGGEQGTGPGRRGTRRALPAPVLQQAIGRARATVEGLESWPPEQSLENHLEGLERLLKQALGWSQGGRNTEIWGALAELKEQSPGALQLSFREFLRFLRAALADVGFKILGGRGGGVQVLSVMEARGLTFEHLFILGMARDKFPRPIREDPLLPDSLRALLRGLLPDIPIKRRGFEEERYLFAQLLSSSPQVTLSRPLATLDGRPSAASPLWERLRWSPREPSPVERVTSLYSQPDPEGRIRAPGTHTVLAGLFGNRDQFRQRFMTLSAVSQEGAGSIGHGRLRVLDEMDPDLRTAQGRRRSIGLGPYLGLVGPVRAKDPRRRPLSLTILEGMAACSWQTFLRRLLRLEPNPDPLQALPELSPLLVGQLVHGVIESIVEAAAPRRVGADFREALEAAPGSVPWPAPQDLEEILIREARSLLQDQGIAFLQLAGPLALRARPYLEVAFQSLWAEGQPLLASGSEVEGSLLLGESSWSRPVSFRADLLCEVAGERRILDLKTGRPLSRNKTPKGRRADLFRAVARGERLQAVAYLVAAQEAATSAGEISVKVEGGYLFLDPATDAGLREVSVVSEDTDIKEAFARSSSITLEAWQEGAFPPRLVDPKTDKEPRRCQFCAVAEACLRGDSGARRRLLRVSEGFPDEVDESDSRAPLERAFQSLWQLGSAS